MSVLRFAPSGPQVPSGDEPPPEGYVVTADADGNPIWAPSGAGFFVGGTPEPGKFVGWDGVQPFWLFPAPPISILTFVHAPTVVLLGATVTNPAFTASYNEEPTEALLTDTEGNTNDVSGTPDAFVSPHAFTKTVYAQFVRFTLSASLSGTADDATSTITWGQLVYWGAAVDPGVYTQAFIKALGSNALRLTAAGSFPVTSGAGTNTFYASRTAYGLTALSFQVNGLPFAISKVGAAIALTNANGVTENYDLWMSDNASLGAFTFTVS